jgi:Rps23 Pro-64 3,4-dihydroxylase Tpa1-like proline 4-hydroxylase
MGSLARGRLPASAGALRTRFEFSVLKADGGEVAPHTDTPKKIVTLVMTMIGDGEWKPEYGGGLDVNRPTDMAYAYNWNNRIVPWDKIEIIDTIPFVPNQCTVFVKTFNSLHSVRKMTEKGSEALRKTITIVIEHDE